MDIQQEIQKLVDALEWYSKTDLEDNPEYKEVRDYLDSKISELTQRINGTISILKKLKGDA